MLYLCWVSCYSVTNATIREAYVEQMAPDHQHITAAVLNNMKTDILDERLRKYLEQGRAAYHAGDFEAAEKYLESVLEQHRGFADVHNILGVIRHHRGEFSRARERLEEALQLNPRYTDAALNLAITYNHLGMFDEAKALYSGILSETGNGQGHTDPFVLGKLANMHADLADAYASSGMISDAVREYRRAIYLRPDFPDLRTRLAATLRDSGDLDAALLELISARDRHPSYIPARLALGMAFLVLGKIDEAMTEWNAILLQDPTNTRAKLYLQMAQNQRDELDKNK